MTTNDILKKKNIFAGETRGDIVFDVVNCVIVVILSLIFLYPLIYVVSASFSSANAIWTGAVKLLPVEFTLRGYELAFQNNDIWTGYLNSIKYVSVGTLVSVSLSLVTAYPLSRRDFAPRNVVMFLYVFCIYFNGGLIPTYLLVKNLGLIDTMWAVILPISLSTWNIIMIRTFFTNTIPVELREAAEMDGCSNTRFFLKIVIPLSSAIVAVMSLFYAVAMWNSYFGAMLYLSSRSKFPLQLILREVLVVVQMGVYNQGVAGTDVKNLQEIMRISATLKYTVIVIGSVPVLVMYPFVQKYFVRGIMIGAIKT